MWQPYGRPRALDAGTRLERQRAPVRFGNLTTQDEADTRSLRRGCEKRHEQIRRIRQTRAFIVYIHRHVMPVSVPADTNGATRLQRRVDSVAHEIDQQLLELIWIGVHND